MQGRHFRRSHSRSRRATIACAAATTILTAGAAGCLNRPIEGAEPRSTSTITERLTQGRVDKIDLLLAIDNSGSMADKQEILAEAIPDLVEGLVNPRCLTPSGEPVASQPRGPMETCPDGSFREFKPVLDVHIGIITSSLGDYGGDMCSGTAASKHDWNDAGRLVSRRASPGGEAVPTYENTGFLAWDPGQKMEPHGESVMGLADGGEGLIPTLKEMVKGVGQVGCGFEAQLESWYRFLVDPQPYAKIVVENGVSKPYEEGGSIVVDEVLLAQRAEFLRPDSLLAILMLSDENDCSINELGVGHKVTTFKSDLPGPTGLRCFDQKTRYGKDYLHPVERYVKGLTSLQVEDRQGNLVPNPLFSDLNPTDEVTQIRDKSLVFLAGLVGVPWQDVARDPKDLTKGFKDAAELKAKDQAGHDTWAVVLGDPEKGTKPLDPFMSESVAPRKGGVNPVTGEAIEPPGAQVNGINGHERAMLDKDDLQYACILPLPAPKDCSDGSCDCYAPDAADPNPLCKKDENGNPTAIQTHAKAYPGLRQLSVLKELDSQGIVASVCAAQMTDRARADYGYRPAIGALVDQLKMALGGQCLPRTLTPNDEDQVSCLILEARKADGVCACDPDKARLPVTSEHMPAVSFAREDEAAQAAGWDCFCEIPQLKGRELEACQNDTSRVPELDGASVDGWCYVDATTSTGNPDLVATCPSTEKRMIRLVGQGQVATDATMFITCSGE